MVVPCVPESRAVRCGAGHSIRSRLWYLAAFLPRLFRWLLQDTNPARARWQITEPHAAAVRRIVGWVMTAASAVDASYQASAGLYSESTI